jgi:hypothetical protein
MWYHIILLTFTPALREFTYPRSTYFRVLTVVEYYYRETRWTGSTSFIVDQQYFPPLYPAGPLDEEHEGRDGYRNIITGCDPCDHCSGACKRRLQKKATYLKVALQGALATYPKRNWNKCCKNRRRGASRC